MQRRFIDCTKEPTHTPNNSTFHKGVMDCIAGRDTLDAQFVKFLCPDQSILNYIPTVGGKQ